MTFLFEALLHISEKIMVHYCICLPTHSLEYVPPLGPMQRDSFFSSQSLENHESVFPDTTAVPQGSVFPSLRSALEFHNAGC